ncbi:MAG TPA: gamma-glutamyl-gamma-aminobutyrate hydrolase family protein [Chloroflexota bacterium]|jgi:putative glutamine amidotransferase|nr:gamma-glutamyl-gamma-aminobutyrate hydrolase family protein [Chloroflexota bacterium]
MARRPLIGITCSVGTTPTGAARIQLNQTYERAIREAGGLPVLLAPGLDEAAMDQLTGDLQGLLLPGGLDVDPARYGAERHATTESNAPLDDLEFPMVDRVLRAGMPVLAICRGIQLLNVACGGSLWQDLPSERPTNLVHPQVQVPRDHLAHSLRLTADSRLAGVLGQTELPVNSFHHQALRTLGEGLQPVGWAEDGTLEAVEGPGRFVIGVQCHPEELVQSQPTWRCLFAAFVDAARA